MSSAEGPLGVVNMAATTLYVADLDKAIDWYREKLGLESAMAGTDALRHAAYLFGSAIVTPALMASEFDQTDDTIDFVN